MDGVPQGLPDTAALAGRMGGENFTVASRLLPRRARRELMAIYSFARLVDEIGDAYPGDRLAALDWAESQLRRGVDPHGDRPEHPVIGGVAGLVASGRLTADPLLDLVDANRQDQKVHGYETFTDLLSYCQLSANPVGRLVLEATGARTDERAAWSDSICTGLQLAEHWQDVREDALAGRVYIPAEDLRSFGVDPAELASAPPAGAALRGLMCFEAWRARVLLDSGLPLVRSLTGAVKVAVAGFWAGGHAALDALADRGFDPLPGAPKPSRRRVARLTISALGGSGCERVASATPIGLRQ